MLDTQTWTWYEPDIQGTTPMHRSYATGTLITNEYIVFAFGKLIKTMLAHIWHILIQIQIITGGIATERTSDMDVLKLPGYNSNGDLDLSSAKWVNNVVTNEIENANTSPEGVKGGIIAAIVVVCVVAALIIAAILYRFRHRARRIIMRIHYDLWNPRYEQACH